MFFSKSKKGNALPLLSLRDVVIFPNQVKPLVVGRPKSVAALLKADSQDKSIVVVMQRDGDVSKPTAEDLHNVGILGKVLQTLRLPDNKYRVLIQGERRVKIEEVIDDDLFWRAEITEFDTPTEDEHQVHLLLQVVQEQFSKYATMDNSVPDEMVDSINGISDAERLSDSLAPHLCSKPEEMQEMLQVASPSERLQRLAEILQEKSEVLEVDKRIQSRVKEQMERNQKEYYLNEKMQAIQKELGDDDEGQNEFAEFKDKILEIGMSEEAQNKALRELNRLKKMSPMSAEATVSRSYLDWLLSIPWQESFTEMTDLKKARKILNDEHYGLREVKQRIIEYLSVRQVAPKGKTPILCLVGPPGIGKTSLARSIANATGRPYVRQALGGVRDESEIRGHRRTYIGSMPGKIIQSIRRAGAVNPVFLLDEIDKMSGDFHHGDPSAALLEALDPEQNSSFRDHYIDTDYDLSQVLFVCTANTLQQIPAPLQDRLEIIPLSSYTEPEKIRIAQKHLIPKQLEANGLDEDAVHFSSGSLVALIRKYTRESGVRELERQVGKICRKVVTHNLETGSTQKVWLSDENISLLLGPPKYLDRDARLQSQVGVVNGLAVTPWGGEMLEIEVATLPGKGDLILTGRLGDWLKESARAGLSCIRMRQEDLNLSDNFHSQKDIHIHYPGNALKTDGPSAGLAMSCAVLSSLVGKAIRSDIAMTGEISLRGKVLAVGGIKEKILAAHSRGVKLVFLPKENEPSLEKIPEFVRSELEIRPVSSIDEVLPYIFKKEEEKKNIVVDEQ